MMAELIRMSLFCDTEAVSDSRLEPLTDERPFTSCSFFHPGHWSCQNNTATILDSIVRFSNTVAEAKVGLSTFYTNTVSPDSIFGNDYLQPVVEVKHTKTYPVARATPVQRAPPAAFATPVEQPEKPKPVVLKVKDFNLPPFSYRALTIAAIFLSKRERVTRSDVIEDITDMFEEHRVVREKLGSKWTRNICRVSKVSVQKNVINEGGYLRLNYASIDMNIFCPRKQRVGDTEYTGNLFSAIGCPEKYHELFDLVEKAREKRVTEAARTWQAMGREETASVTVIARRSVKRTSSDSVSISGQEVAKRACLRLPSRPCFNDDDNSNDSLQPSMAEARVDHTAHVCTTSSASLPAFTSTFLSDQLRPYTPMEVVGGFPYYASGAML